MTATKKPARKKKLKQLPLLPAEELPSIEEEINNMINLGKLKAAILEQHGTVTAYAEAHGLTLQEMSRFLNKNAPITLKAVWKHCKNLGISYRITLASPSHE